MKGRLSRAFQKELRKSLLTFRKHFKDTPQHSENLSTVQYKEYIRAGKFPLPPTTLFSADLGQTLITRRTPFSFVQTKMKIFELSNLLQYAAGVRDRGNPESQYRTHPSGGGLYPLELYIVVQENCIEGIPPGVYHYNIKEHLLETLGGTAMLQKARGALFIKKNVPVVILISSVWERTMQKYDDIGFKLALIEAGHLAQNILLVAQGLGFSGWPFINFDEKEINKTLDLEQRGEEDIIYAIGLGKT